MCVCVHSVRHPEPETLCPSDRVLHCIWIHLRFNSVNCCSFSFVPFSFIICQYYCVFLFFYSLQVFFCFFFPINNSYNTIRLLYIHIASVAQYTRDNVWLKGGKHNKNIGIYLSIYPPLLKSTHTTYITKCKQAT